MRVGVVLESESRGDEVLLGFITLGGRNVSHFVVPNLKNVPAKSKTHIPVISQLQIRSLGIGSSIQGVRRRDKTSGAGYFPIELTS